VCPCHNSQFGIAGDRRNDVAPRGMDTLAWRTDPNDPDLIQVQYENFIQGEKTKELKA
jgi:Rieske Fe-S protein